jgi:putative membrane protein
VLKRFALTIACNVAAIFVASVFIDGVDYGDKFWVLVVAGAVFGVVNLLVKPIVKLLALPLVVLTLGLALFGINLFMLYLTSWIVGPFSFESIGDAVWATLIVWAVNSVLYSMAGISDRKATKKS